VTILYFTIALIRAATIATSSNTPSPEFLSIAESFRYRRCCYFDFGRVNAVPGVDETPWYIRSGLNVGHREATSFVEQGLNPHIGSASPFFGSTIPQVNNNSAASFKSRNLRGKYLPLRDGTTHRAVYVPTSYTTYPSPITFPSPPHPPFSKSQPSWTLNEVIGDVERADMHFNPLLSINFLCI
jgi:hypothetical protein